MNRDFEPDLAQEAGRRWSQRTDERGETQRALRLGGYSAAENNERLFKRILHLEQSALREKARTEGGASLRPPKDALSSARISTVGLERVLGDANFHGLEFVELALAVARFVGRIHIRNRLGRTIGYGTGFMVSPRLLLTNHHVLGDEGEARHSEVEFDYQKDRSGRLMPVETYGLEPDVFFAADRGLDWALVAVALRSVNGKDLARYGWNRLIGTEGKVLRGDPLNIIQHPRARTKQIVFRANRLVDLLADFAHYETDTEPGSSGSPVFNDMWEVVALHHAGVPETNEDDEILTTDGQVWRPGMDPDLIHWVANEGARISRIVRGIEALSLTGERDAIRDELLTREPPHPFEAAEMADDDRRRSYPAGAPTSPGRRGEEPGTSPAVVPASDAAAAGPGPGITHTWTIPLTVTVGLGPAGPVGAVGATGATADVGVTASPDGGDVDVEVGERIDIDPDYRSRPGYDDGFLGRRRRVPLPGIPDELLSKLARNRMASCEGDAHVLPYHHFSVIMHGERRLALLTAANIDGRTLQRFKRGTDRWALDPRIAEDEQAGEDLYRSNPLDRGHLVRRLDPSWGPTPAAAKRAADDTFHFTNCAPQHEGFNRNRTTWAGMENYILDNADLEELKVSVFTGPVFRDDDPEHRGVRVPREFWKVVAAVKRGGKLSVTGYRLSQAELLSDLPEEEFRFGAYRTFQVPLAEIEAMSGLDFSAVAEHDPLGRGAGEEEIEGGPVRRELTEPADAAI